MDQELIAYFDEHFRESRRYTESLHEQTTQQIAGLRQEVTGLRQEMGEQISGLRQEMGEQISGLRQEMGEQISGLRQETTEQIRHTQILVEDMHGKVQLIAEGYFGIVERLTVFQGEVADNFKVVHSTLNVHYRDFDRRLRTVEERTQRQGRDPLDVLREQLGKSGTG
jgi:uncharacterized protein YoxC